MLVPNSGLRIDSPSWPLLQAHLSYWGITSGAGNVLGTTIACANLANEPNYTGLPVKILSGNASGQVRLISSDIAGVITVADPFTNAAGAACQITASTRFCILSQVSGGGSPSPPSPSIGLWMFGECDPGMAASTVTLVMPNLAGFPNDIFNNEFYVQVIHNNNAPGVAPEGEIRKVTDYVGATGTFTTDAFTANVEANDLVCVIHESLITPGLEIISDVVSDIFDLVNAILVTTETGGTRTTTAAEQDMYINNAPAGVYKPLVLKISTTNMIAGDSIVIRIYERISSTGALELQSEKQFDGVQNEVLKKIILYPNRHGVETTIQRVAGGDRAYIWEAVFDL